MAVPQPAPAALERLLRKEADMAFRQRARTIVEWLGTPDDRRVLDCGCGRGFYLATLRALGWRRLVGVDFALAWLAKARRNLGALPTPASGRPEPPATAPVANASVHRLPFADQSFDAIVLSEVLEHVDPDVGALRELRRLLRPGGALLLTVPHARYPFWWDPINRTLESTLRVHVGRGPLAGIWAGHRRLYTREALRAAVLEAGLEVVEERAFTHHCLPFAHDLLYGLGKPLIESRLLRRWLEPSFGRAAFDGPDPGPPMSWLLSLLAWTDRRNRASEPAGRSTVNLALLARRPST